MGGVFLICGLSISFGITNLNEARNQLLAVEKTVEKLDKENRALYATVQKIKHDPKAIEKLARKEFGWLKPDEISYKLNLSE